MKRFRWSKINSDDFWNKIDKSKGLHACWPWLNSTNSSGHGCIKSSDEKRSYGTTAHRVAFMIYYSIDLPKKIQVHHNCPFGDNPKCCNPRHLWLGNQKDNVRDCITKGRKPTGEKHYNSVLTEKSVMEILKDKFERGFTGPELAKKYKVSKGCIQRVVEGTSWSNIHNEYHKRRKMPKIKAQN